MSGRTRNDERNNLLSAMWISGKSIETITETLGFKNAHVAYQRIAALRKLYGKKDGKRMFPSREKGRKK